MSADGRLGGMRAYGVALAACMAVALAAEAAWSMAGEPPAGDEAKDAPKAETAKADAKEREFEPPPGYKRVKRGKHVLYCRKDTEIGTRFPVTKCYSEEQLAQIEMAQERGNREFEQRRRICSTQTACH